MSEVIIKPFIPGGVITPPPSKSDVHRAIICASFAKGVSEISPVALSNDIKATIDCMRALGAVISISDDVLTVDGTDTFSKEYAELDCCESGSTLRFLIPVAAAGGVSASFTGQGRLPDRPIGIYLDILPEKGVECISDGTLPLKIQGFLKPGEYRVPGNISSQFISGLLFALSLLDEDSDILLTSDIESRGYIDMTISAMKKFGVTAEETEKGYHVKGNQKYIPQKYSTSCDYSQAAFFLAAGAINGEVTVKGLDLKSDQGDRKILDIIKDAGADIAIKDDTVTVRSGHLNALDIDASQIPDLVPILSVLLCRAEGVSRIYNAKRLRIKESDRLKSTRDLIEKLGGKISELDDGLEITGTDALHGNRVNGYNDHRIVMCAAICACMCDGDIISTDAQSIRKSYPNFFEDLEKIGGKTEIIR